MVINPIGVIRTPFKQKEDTPIQGKYSPDSTARVEVFPKYASALKDIETFSHIILLYHFDRIGKVQLVRPTFLDDSPHGIFASRHPCRPNSLGLTVVRLKKRSKNILFVSGVDILDKTPLIDINPYIPRFDCFSDASNGWVAKVRKRKKPKGRE